LQQYRGELKSLFQEIFACFQVDKQLFEKKAAYYREQNAILHKRRSEKLISREEFLEQSGHLLQKLPVIPQHQLVREIEHAARFLTGTDCSWESIGALLDSLQ
jgi:hypothetical protein